MPSPSAAERVYRLLVRLYPHEFREMFGESMIDFYRERRDGLRGRAALGARCRLFIDATIGALVEHVAPLRPRHAPRRPPLQQFLGDRHMFANLRQDLGYALHNLTRTPAFTVTVLLTLAIGIGANVAIFSVVNGVLLHPLPFPDADRVIQLANGDSPATLSEPEVADLERGARDLSAIGAYSYTDANITGDSDAERVRVARVNGGFFRVLAPAPFLGRAIVADDDRAGAADVVVISHGLWQRRFGMDRSAVGRQIVVDDIPRTIVGVMAPRFDYPNAAVALWTPLRLDRDAMTTRNNHYLRVVARLAPGVAMGAADAEVRAMRDAWARDYPGSYRKTDPLNVDVRQIRDRVVGAAEPYLVALLGAVTFVLLIACVNVANLLVARSESRRKEMMIRSALGATRGRIAAQLSLESGVLVIVGGVLGFAAAWPALRGILAFAPDSIPRVEEIHLDVRALGFAASICVLIGVLFSLAPLMANPGTLADLNSGSRNATQSGGRTARRSRSALVVSEIALAVMMLCGATLFVRTLIGFERTDLGFATSGVVTAQITLPRPAYNGAAASRFVAQLVDRLRAMPGVTNAAAMAWIPINASGGNWSLVAEGAVSSSVADAPLAEPQQVTPGFFATLSIPLVRGREFTTDDRAAGDPVVIVNDALATKLWGTTDVIGRRLRLSTNGMPFMTVVGVAANTRVEGLTEKAPPVMYFPHDQARVSGYFTSLSMAFVVRTTNADAVIPAIKAAVREMDSRVPVSDLRTMADVVSSSIARHRFTTVLLSGLAALAIVLAAIGIYGIIAYSVAQRRYEFGVRVALGAGRSGVVALVLREGFSLTAVGLALGGAGSVALSRVLRTLLVGTGGVDVWTMASVSGIVLVVTLAAQIGPVRHALSIDPTEALRNG